MSKRYSGKSFKDSSVMKKPKLSFKEKRKLKRERKNRMRARLLTPLRSQPRTRGKAKEHQKKTEGRKNRMQRIWNKIC